MPLAIGKQIDPSEWLCVSRYGLVMTVLVDDARWPWRDTYWCHLVSDNSLSELHEFASRLGCRRLGFQGDHYDIDVLARELAIDLGATACTSRELLARLKAANLRLRPKQYAKWELIERWEGGVNTNSLIEATPTLLSNHHEIVASVNSVESGFVEFGFALERRQSVAIGLFGSGSVPNIDEDPYAGVHVRVERTGKWSVELVHPPLTDAE